MEFLRSLIGERQSRRSAYEATTRRLDERDVKVAKLKLKARLLADKGWASWRDVPTVGRHVEWA